MENIDSQTVFFPKTERDFWENFLEQFEGQSFFPCDRNFYLDEKEFTTISFDLPKEVQNKILKLSNNSDHRIFLILFTGISYLLKVYSGNEDVLIGTSVDRQSQEGNFINKLLLLRNKITDDESFKTLLLASQRSYFDVLNNQNFALEKLLDENGEINESGGAGFFDVFVLLKNIQEFDYINKSLMNICFLFERSDSAIMSEVKFNNKMYKSESVHSICETLKTLLQNALSNVDVPLNRIEILNELIKKDLLNNFRGIQTNFNIEKGIHAAIEIIAKKNPDATALICEDKFITYKEMITQADRYAKFLISKGHSSGDVIAICMERSVELICCIIGIFKAGGIYLPIDILLPESRIEYILVNAEAKAMIVNTDMSPCPELRIDFYNIDHIGERTENLQENCDIENEKAYIIYTSGSTGKPKGVLVNHKSILNTLHWRKNYYNFREKQSVLQIPNFAFDSSIEDIFTPLISGSELVMVKNEKVLSYEYIGRIMERNCITHFLVVPNFFQTLLETIPEKMKYLSFVTLAGESFDMALVNKHFSTLSHVKLFNEYGPTENSVCSTVYELKPDNERVLIGKPIDNVQAYILNENLLPVPVNVAGELFLSGDGLANCYVNNEILTNTSFIPNPFAEGKMYKTGDRTRWTGDGNIEFLGRLDSQIKIRGYRVEISEVESSLNNLENVSNSIVVCKKNNRNENYLHAFIQSSESLNTDEIKLSLSRKIPQYMIPASFMIIDSFPLNQNGKIDRNKLKEIEINSKKEKIAVQAKTPIEKDLYDIWCNILLTKDISVNDNFFEVGGNSLNSISIAKQIADRFGFDFQVIKIYEYLTISDLAVYIEKEQREVISKT